MTLSLLISGIAGGLFSVIQELADAYWPKLNEQPPVIKRILSWAVSFVAGLVVFGLACGGVLAAAFPELIEIPCDSNGALLLVAYFVTSLTGHQVTHLVAKKS